MRIVGMYSFKGGKEMIEAQYASALQEVQGILSIIDSEQHRTKVSAEKTMVGKLLYSPRKLNNAIKQAFYGQGWQTHRVLCEYSTDYYTLDYQPHDEAITAYREMDFIRDKVGVEVQFGKYAFMVYNVCAKMTIFHNLSMIDIGIEIVPVKDFARHMSTGVSYFEQIVWDLNQRGTADIDIPVLGITSDLS